MTPSASPADHGGRWVLLALLVVSICINYVDRGNLAVAAATPSFRSDLGLSDEHLGVLFSVFFVTYAACQILAGWSIDRFNVFTVFTLGFVLWSAATIFTGFVGSFAGLLAFRLLLGVGEAAAYPSYSKIIAARFVEQQRGFANSLIDGGSRIGPAIGVLAGGLIAARYGWRMVFIAIGIAGTLWLLPWFWVLRRGTGGAQAAARGSQAGPGFLAILRRRQAWGTFLGLFCLNYSWYFVLNWLPSYLTKERHYSTRMMAWYGSLPFWGLAAMIVLSGWVSDRFIRRGFSPTRVRLTCLAGGLMLNALMIPAYLVQDPAISMALLVVACLALGVATSNLWAVTQTLAGREAVGKWVGLQNGVGNIAGMLSPYLTGVMANRLGSFFMAFVAASAVAVVGGLSYWLVVRRVEPIQWTESG
jgi:MFS family permease